MKLSLCCISNVLAEKDIKFRTMTFKSFSSKSKTESLEKLSDIVRNNFNTTEKIIRHCAAVGIKGYRISSDLTPVINHPEVNLNISELPNFKLIQYEINKVKTAIRETGIRVSAHPSEYISLTSDDPNVIKNSIRDLEQHAEIFNYFELENNTYNPLNIHCRKDGDPIEISDKFKKNFELLSDSVKSRLVLENNDNAKGVWSVRNLIKYFPGYSITFDTLHHKMLPDEYTEEEAFNAAYNTWKFEPIFHYSEGKDNTRAHRDMAESLPPNYGKDVIWDVELKGKDYAILEMIDRGGQNGN
jgi:UV DNA damage endonuclease